MLNPYHGVVNVVEIESVADLVEDVHKRYGAMGVRRAARAFAHTATEAGVGGALAHQAASSVLLMFPYFLL